MQNYISPDTTSQVRTSYRIVWGRRFPDPTLFMDFQDPTRFMDLRPPYFRLILPLHALGTLLPTCSWDTLVFYWGCPTLSRPLHMLSRHFLPISTPTLNFWPDFTPGHTFRLISLPHIIFAQFHGSILPPPHTCMQAQSKHIDPPM